MTVSWSHGHPRTARDGGGILMRTDKLGSAPTVLSTLTAVLVAGSLAYAAGVRPPAQAAAETPGQADTTVTEPTTLTGAATPAANLMVALLGNEASWGVRLPAPFGCATTPGAVSASNRTGITLHAFPAGQARQALDAIRCGNRTTVNGAPAVRMPATGGTIVAWARGDVIATISAANLTTEQVAEFDQRLVGQLSEVCVDLAPAPEHATRNPINVNYTPFTVETTVTIDSIMPKGGEDADLPSPEPLTELVVPAVPRGVVGPPLPVAVPKPTTPSEPGPEPLTATIAVETADTTGPGCGWDFIGQQAPTADLRELTKKAEEATTNARADLIGRQKQWATTVTAYRADLARYITDSAAWNAYASAARDVIEQWNAQRDELDAYERGLAEHERSVQARADFLAEQAEARAQYSRDVAACRDVASQPTPTPTPAPTSTPHVPTPTPSASASPTPPPPVGYVPTCQVIRPAILDQAPPEITPAPSPPTLWSPDA